MIYFTVLSFLEQGAAATSHLASLEGVVEQLTRFRSQVREFALTRIQSPTKESSNKPGLYPERIALLKACDTLRNDLAPLGVLIKAS